jgi:hypothetical protein
MRAALGLANDRPVPLEAELLEGAHDAGRGPGHLPRPIEILDSQQPAPAVGARIQEARDRRI